MIRHFTRSAPTPLALILPFILFTTVGARAAADPPALPDPIMTPGAIDPAATRDVVCNGTTRERRHVSASAKRQALAAYNIPAADSAFYEIDHLIPLAIGGANVLANLWPQPWAEADKKDVLEVELQRRVCLGLLDQAQAQREVADDWPAAYSRYIGGALVATPGYDGQAASEAPPPRIGLKTRLKAEAWRLGHRLIEGFPTDFLNFRLHYAPECTFCLQSVGHTQSGSQLGWERQDVE